MDALPYRNTSILDSTDIYTIIGKYCHKYSNRIIYIVKNLETKEQFWIEDDDFYSEYEPLTEEEIKELRKSD